VTDLIDLTARFTMPAAMSLLPAKMDSPEARAMILAIGLQESNFEHRKQIVGPARGLFQFESGGGIRGVLTHRASAEPAMVVCEALLYEPSDWAVYLALADNDVLACAFARLLLWTLPAALPKQGDAEEGWRQYIAAWRPGKPHPATWGEHFNKAWSLLGD